MRILLLSSLLFVSCVLLSACGSAPTQRPTDTSEDPTETQIEDSMKLLRHVVLFQFNDTATDEVVSSIEEAFAELPAQIAEIHDFEWGVNNSPEGLNKGLTHCFFVTFLSEKDRAIYLPHPAHQAFVKLVDPYVEDVTVVDYWVQ